MSYGHISSSSFTNVFFLHIFLKYENIVLISIKKLNIKLFKAS